MANVADIGVDDTTHFAINYGEKPTVRDIDFFRMVGVDEVYAVDISDFEGAEILLDLNRPLAPELEGTCGLLVDGSTLDNIFDPCTGLKNIARMLAPGGRCFLVNMGNASNDFTGIPYTMFNPLWFYDYFTTNNFEYCQVYATIYTADFKPHMTYALSHEHLARIYDPGMVRPIITPATMVLTVYAEKGADSTWDRLPTQHAYRPEEEWARFCEITKGYHDQQRPYLEWGLGTEDPHKITPGWVRVMPDGSWTYTMG
jgi:hypothetical protein